MSARDHDHPKPQEHNRPPEEAAKVPVPGAARIRGPEERTPAEDVLGEDVRASDELMGDDRPTPDQLLRRARLVAPEVVSDRLAEIERERMKQMGVARKGGGPVGASAPRAHLPGPPPAPGGLGPLATPDAEKVERREAWEHVPDLERTSNELEAGEGEAPPVSVTRPVERASYDEAANSAYDEDVPGAGIHVDRPARAAPADEEAAAPKKRARRTKKTSQRSEAAKKKAKAKKKGTEADASP